MDPGIPRIWSLGDGWRHSSGPKRISQKVQQCTPRGRILSNQPSNLGYYFCKKHYLFPRRNTNCEIPDQAGFVVFYKFCLSNLVWWVGFGSMLRSWTHYRKVRFIDFVRLLDFFGEHVSWISACDKHELGFPKLN